MNHTEQAQKIADATGWRLDEDAEERGWSGIGIGPVGQHRDSEALERSNFRVIYDDLVREFGDPGAHVDIARFGHWAVGWVEEIIWNTGDPAIVEVVQKWRDALDDYPVADESDFSALEWEDNHPENDPHCYSDDPDCGCGREKA